MDFLSLHKYTILKLLGIGGGLHSLNALVCKTGWKKILKPKKLFKTHHNKAAVISQPHMKTNKCIYYWDFLTICCQLQWVSKFSDLEICDFIYLLFVWVQANEQY